MWTHSARTAGAIVLTAALALTACTAKPTAPQPHPDTTRLTEYLDGLVQRQEFRGAVRIQVGDRILLNRGYDKADPNGADNGPDTRFRIGSITKQFTALAILKLHEQGKLTVTDPACRYVPHCPPAWAPISIQQLLTHTSGVFNYTELSEAEKAAALAKLGSRPTPEQVIGVVADRPLEFPPGSRWKYSNTGFAILGQIIELVSGQDYGTFLRQQILDPLGMKDTGYPDPTDGHPVATGYQDWSTVAGDPYVIVAFSAGGLYSTANDLARWNHFLLTGSPPVVARDTLAELLRPRVEANSLEHYGYGIMLRGTAEKPVYFHGGRINGYVAYNEVRPADGLAVTVLSNLATVNVDQTGNNLANLATG